MKKGFDPSQFLTDMKSAEEINETEIKMISVYDMLQNPNNTYSISKIKELAQWVEQLNGIKTPLLVTPCDNDDKYRIVSGDRRHLAVKYLLEDAKSSIITSPLVPCFVKKYKPTDEHTAEELEQLDLIGANTYREKTTMDYVNELKQMEKLAKSEYDKLNSKEKGRFRDFFAQKLGMSSSELQRRESLSKLNSKIIEDIDVGKLSKYIAIEFASLSDNEQLELYKKYNNDNLSYEELKKLKKSLKNPETDPSADLFEETPSEDSNKISKKINQNNTDIINQSNDDSLDVNNEDPGEDEEKIIANDKLPLSENTSEKFDSFSEDIKQNNNPQPSDPQYDPNYIPSETGEKFKEAMSERDGIDDEVDNVIELSNWADVARKVDKENAIEYAVDYIKNSMKQVVEHAIENKTMNKQINARVACFKNIINFLDMLQNNENRNEE